MLRARDVECDKCDHEMEYIFDSREGETPEEGVACPNCEEGTCRVVIRKPHPVHVSWSQWRCV